MAREFNSLDEIQKYYNEESNTYIFKEAELYIFRFNLDVDANIDAYNIIAWDIKANNIDACNIDCYKIVAKNINANNIRCWNINANDIDVYNLDCKDIVVKNINACNINASDIEADDIETNEDIKAWNIYAHNITAQNIIADNIYAHDISYWALCFAMQNIECHSIKGRRDNHKYFVLDGYIYIDGKLELKNKSSKALKIIKEKNVDIEYIKTCFFDEKGGFKEYNAYVGHDEEYELTQEEYDLLKEVLEDE